MTDEQFTAFLLGEADLPATLAPLKNWVVLEHSGNVAMVVANIRGTEEEAYQVADELLTAHMRTYCFPIHCFAHPPKPHRFSVHCAD